MPENSEKDRPPAPEGERLMRPGVRPGMRGWYHRGRWMVDRERFGIDSDAPVPPFHEPEALRDGLRVVLGRMGLQSANVQSILLAEWVELVGEDVARHTRPGSLRGKELTVFVRGSLWYAQLKRVGTAAIQEKIIRRLGAESVNRVVLRPDPEGGTPA